MWYVEPVPIFNEPIPQILLREKLFGINPEPFFKSGIEVYQQDHVPSSRANVLTHQPRICTENTCMVDSGIEPFYADDDHLSVAGALYYKETFAPLFKRCETQ